MGSTFSAAALAELVGGRLIGDPDRLVSGARPPEEAEASDLTFALDPPARRLLEGTRAGVAVTPQIWPLDHLTQIVVENPRLAMARLLGHMFPQPIALPPVGIDPAAVVHPSALIDSTATVAALVYVGPQARIGAGTYLYPGVYVGSGVVVGSNCLIYPNVVLMDGVCLGDRVIVHAGSVLGSDGYGFVPTPEGHLKVPQVGTVVVGDDVELGANVAIDRATMGFTCIGTGTKIDNLVHIGHNDQVGRHCLIVSQVGLAGSVKVGDRTVIAGQAGVANQTTIGADCLVLARSGVTKDLPDHSKVSGFPAQEHKQELRQQAARSNLPQIFEQLRQLQQRVQQLEKEMGRL
ncbi:UDP-3-O-(3-hydroxymyristoyl)glucosamine N-acyltransferase [Gloeobacter kilaueensis]|uniref:UDP-3-O-acylglucosamine N-acyltransferase n=1 Tax=Gloeobacter kilaueensis (strain ATCC BAA-2537 / CCAP 1431/1 / ULC 316 / JS1) TaxID=1183438 RepID=U5QLL6_GLOK1|nr:UDP-3-O-(3-hydroxymyristoyl)glucosamine N-acyltransferase [Gloeobacter kilaueensis]AGY58575.1 UDP-3-O-[3-hydroxymyristoyl] glucosamine N-acyltransferase [Gloeobacter kilaueensis JS1]